MSQTHDEPKPPPLLPAAPHLDYGASLETWRDAMMNWTRGLFDCGNEVSQFVAMRMRNDFEAWKDLARCRSAADFTTYQSVFMQRVMADYLEEAGRMFQLATRVGNVAAGALTSAPAADSTAETPNDSPTTTKRPHPAHSRAAA
jgi:hypothetical protein